MKAATMKFIHLTDTHLIAGGGDLHGTNPRSRLRQAIAHILANQIDADAMVVTGDLTHLGHAQAYEYLRECLTGLPMPVYPILGNHDRRETFQDYFPAVARDPAGFVQYTRAFGGYQAIFLDTNEPGVEWGVFCETRAAWLREQLAATDTPVLLFLHHPFFPLGIRSMDAISLRDTAPLRAALQGHESRIRHVFFGHVHRPISGSYCGIPFSTLRGTNHQVALSLGKDEPDILGSQETPQYGVVLLDETSVVVHVEDYLDDSPRFYLRATGG